MNNGANMKILYVSTVSVTMGFFPPHIKMLQDAGHTVELACNLDEPLKESVQQLGCKCHNIPFSRNPFGKDNKKALSELKRILAEGQYDIVHTHTPVASALVRVACKKLRKQGLKVFYTAHGFHFYTGAPLVNWLVYYPVEKICSRWTDVQVTITKEDYERAQKKLHAKKTVYIPGVGIDLDNFCPGTEWNRGDRRTELGIPRDGKLILSVGELNENKNHAVVIDALSELNDSSVYYVICGEGICRDKLEQKISELGLSGHVFLPGIRRDIAEWMAEADVYVHPSLREGLSVSTMEAMSSGLPVICGDIRGNRDLIDNGEGGILVDPSDATQIAGSIGFLLKNKDLREKMSLYNREKVKEFSIKGVLKDLKEIYGVE